VNRSLQTRKKHFAGGARQFDILRLALTAGNEKGGDKIAAVSSSHFLGHPVAELQEFPYFTPLVAVLEGFF
jgi:hypothetical protein